MYKQKIRLYDKRQLICKAINKRLSQWLKLDYVWNLFAARVKKLNLDFKSADLHKSSKTRVSNTFATFIV